MVAQYSALLLHSKKGLKELFLCGICMFSSFVHAFPSGVPGHSGFRWIGAPDTFTQTIWAYADDVLIYFISLKYESAADDIRLDKHQTKSESTKLNLEILQLVHLYSKT